MCQTTRKVRLGDYPESNQKELSQPTSNFASLLMISPRYGPSRHSNMKNYSILPQIVQMPPQTSSNQFKIKLTKNQKSRDRSNETQFKAEVVKEPDQPAWPMESANKKPKQVKLRLDDPEAVLPKTHHQPLSNSKDMFRRNHKTNDDPSFDPASEKTKLWSQNQTAKNSFFQKRNIIEIESLRNQDLNVSIESSHPRQNDKHSTFLVDNFKNKTIYLDHLENTARKQPVKLVPVVQANDEIVRKLQRINSPSAKGSSHQFDFGLANYFVNRRFTNLNEQF